MHIYIWQDAHPITARYHGGGGLLVIAADLDSARAAIAADEEIQKAVALAQVDRPEITECDACTDTPDLTLPLAGTHDPTIIVFPDAGCC